MGSSVSNKVKKLATLDTFSRYVRQQPPLSYNNKGPGDTGRWGSELPLGAALHCML